MKTARLLPALVIALFTGKVFGFWEQGHLMVARIAYDHLSQESPSALQAANNLLQVYSNSNPSMTSLEGDFPFVECSTFADSIKAKGGSYQSGWHFIDNPFFDEGGSINDYPDFQFDEQNIGKVIPALVDWLSGNSGYQNSFAYQQITQHVSNENEAKSYALRLLIHYLGDIHQPLHASSRVNSRYPKGDRGGNSFQVPSKDDAKNLHSVWDSVVYDHADTPSLPYSSSAWNRLGGVCSDLENKYSFSSSEYNSVDVDTWVNESFAITQSNVYNGITEKQSLPSDYVQTNVDVIEKHIVLGGLRLATTIKTIFGNSGAVEEALFLQ